MFDILLELSENIVGKTLMIQKNKNIDIEFFKSIIRNICSTIRKIVEQITKEKFSVCIKSFSLNDLMETKHSEMSTVTLARDSCDYVNRSYNDDQKQKIMNNTSFKELLEKGDLLWACPDLTKIDPQYISGATYQNPDKEYRKYYNSTIVVPIRMRIENVSKTIINYAYPIDAKYHYLGFLCVDSKKTFQQDQKSFKKLCDILVVFGSILYPLLEHYLTNEIERL